MWWGGDPAAGVQPSWPLSPSGQPESFIQELSPCPALALSSALPVASARVPGIVFRGVGWETRVQWAPAARGEVVLACTAPLWPCAGGRGPFGQEDTAPDTLFGKETVVFIFFVKKKKKLEDFF